MSLLLVVVMVEPVIGLDSTGEKISIISRFSPSKN